MSEPLLTKRLHISGLTPSITRPDLERRLSSFGVVKTMDGFGARDALGDPRKFAFVTMDISAKNLAKCFNMLSGSTWKGTKLRIGEAKPDFRQRLAQLNARPLPLVRQKRTHARNHASSTLPLTPLSATAAASTPGWVVAPSGRVVRPMRTRPERPLEPMRSQLKVKSTNGKTKKRIKAPPVRARRRLIDPTKWDSVYLKGVFLDAIPVPLPVSQDVHRSSGLLEQDMEDDQETDTDGGDSDVVSSPLSHVSQGPARVQQLRDAAVAGSSRTHEPADSIGVRYEANAALAMLDQMFGDKEDWDWRESVGEIADDEMRDEEMQMDAEDRVEIVPRDSREAEKSKSSKKDKGKAREKSEGGVVRFSHADNIDVESTLDKDVEMEQTDSTVEVSVPTVESAPQTNLKALFAPKEAASFSFVDHLDLELELELDSDILGISGPAGGLQQNGHASQTVVSTPQVVEIPTTKSTTKARSRVTLDPSLPLLFPLPDSLPYSYGSSKPTPTTHERGMSSCILFPFTTRVPHLHSLPSCTMFARSPEDTSESMRDRWEKDKSALTREWKKAWREARRSRKGRVEVGGEIEGVH